MIQIGLGGWLTCRIWDGMRSLGTVWRIGRSPMKYSMEHSVSRTVVAIGGQTGTAGAVGCRWASIG